MSIIVEQFLSEGGTDENHSMLDFNNKNYAMVLEGYNGINSNPNMPDINWYLENFSKYIEDSASKLELPLNFIIGQTIDTLQIMNQIEAVKNKENIVTDTIATPFASLAMVREYHNNIEVFSLGNCTILIQFHDPNMKMERIYDNSIVSFESEVLEIMQANHRSKNIDIIETFPLPRIQKQWRDFYAKKNRLNGYWVLGLDVKAVNNGIYLRYPAEAVSKITMFTYGFKWLESQFASLKEEKSLKDIYERLRFMENEDASCNRYPRIHKNSDVAAIIASVSIP